MIRSMAAFGLVKTGVFSPHPREHRADLIQSGGERLQLMGLGEEGIFLRWVLF